MCHNVMNLAQSLSAHLAASSVRYMPVSSPPVLAAEQLENISSKSHCQEAIQISCVQLFPGKKPIIHATIFLRWFYSIKPWAWVLFNAEKSHSSGAQERMLVFCGRSFWKRPKHQWGFYCDQFLRFGKEYLCSCISWNLSGIQFYYFLQNIIFC